MKSLQQYLVESTYSDWQKTVKDIEKEYESKYRGRKSWRDYFKYLEKQYNATDIGHDDLDDGELYIYFQVNNVDIIIDCNPDDLDEKCSLVDFVEPNKIEKYIEEWGNTGISLL